jgi:hypothetical protein
MEELPGSRLKTQANRPNSSVKVVVDQAIFCGLAAILAASNVADVVAVASEDGMSKSRIGMAVPFSA